MAKQIDEHTRNESRRAAILEAAQTCFFQYGLERTRMDDIARAAQISRPALYEHFENKSAIFLALARHLIKSFLAAAERELHGSGQVWKRIAAAFEAWSVKPLEMIMAAPHADEMILAGSGLAAEVYREGREKFCQSLTTILQEAARAGEIDFKRIGLTAAATADLIVAAAAGAKEDWTDVARYRKRLAGLLRVFETATSQ
ncbi:MAG: TetR/AcrR family transcriptional regulator [Candidatus Binatia bacterium]